MSFVKIFHAFAVVELMKGVTSVDTQQKTVSWAISDIRLWLQEIAQREEEKSERMKAERKKLSVIASPGILWEKLARRNNDMQEEALAKMQYTAQERQLLNKHRDERKSLNPFARFSARREELELVANFMLRKVQAQEKALQDFQQHELPRICKEHEEKERNYEAYREKALVLDDQKRTADRIVWEAFQLSEKLTTIHRSGVTTIEGIDENASLEEVQKAIDRYYDGIPKEVRRSINCRIVDERGLWAKAFGWDDDSEEIPF